MYYGCNFDDSNIVDELQELNTEVSELRAELAAYQTANTEALTKTNTCLTALMALTVLAAALKVIFTK